MAGTIPELDPLTAPDDADEVEIIDASDTTMSASGSNKRLSWQNIKATLKSYFDTLYAAATHNHAISDVTGLQTALDGKAASSHNHAISDVTGLQTALDGKAASSHNHSASEITSGTLDAARLPTPTTTALGGVKRNTDANSRFVTGIDSNGNLIFGDQPLRLSVPFSDQTSNLSTGTKLTFTWRYGTTTLSGTPIDLTEAPTGSAAQFDLKKNGTTIYSTKPTIDAGETSTSTAATAAVLSTTSLSNGDVVTIIIDQTGSTNPGKGAIVTFIGTTIL